MTPKEAYEWLYIHYIPRGDDINQDDAISTALKALRKQIPRKAIGEHYTHMRCPSCNHRIPSGLGSSSRRRDNWCNYCGQRIEWEDEG